MIVLAVQALHAFELALSLEKLKKLWHLNDVAIKADDYEMAAYVEEMLHKQVNNPAWLAPVVVAVTSLCDNRLDGTVQMCNLATGLL